MDKIVIYKYLIAFFTIIIMICSLSCEKPLTTTFVNNQSMILNIIKEFNGEDSEIVEFSYNKLPIVIYFDYQRTSNIYSNFLIKVHSGEYLGDEELYYTPYEFIWHDFHIYDNFDHITIIQTGIRFSGTYKLKVIATGCKWNIKVCVE